MPSRATPGSASPARAGANVSIGVAGAGLAIVRGRDALPQPRLRPLPPGASCASVFALLADSGEICLYSFYRKPGRPRHETLDSARADRRSEPRAVALGPSASRLVGVDQRRLESQLPLLLPGSHVRSGFALAPELPVLDGAPLRSNGRSATTRTRESGSLRTFAGRGGRHRRGGRGALGVRPGGTNARQSLLSRLGIQAIIAHFSLILRHSLIGRKLGKLFANH